LPVPLNPLIHAKKIILQRLALPASPLHAIFNDIYYNKTAMKLVQKYLEIMDAEIDAALLRSRGIAVFLRDANMLKTIPLYNDPLSGIKLFVSDKDYTAACRILRQNKTGIPDEK